MIPQLYSGSATAFTSLGLGTVPDATECYVTEERNGGFTLDMKVPQTTRYADQLNVGTLIVADASPGQPRQAFEIANVKRSLDGYITVYAEHISYRLGYSIILPPYWQTLETCITRLNSSSIYLNPQHTNQFTFASSGWGTTTGTVQKDEYGSARSVLLGSSGSLLDTFGGCWKWDNFTCTLYNRRGADNGVRIVYGKQLTAATAEYSNTADSTANAVLGTATYNDIVYDSGTAYAITTGATYHYDRVIVKDFTEEFESVYDPSGSDSISDVLYDLAEAYANKYLTGNPTVNVSASFVPLSQTVEYKYLASLESVEIDDTVYVYVPTLDIDVSAKVTKTKYNVLLDRYESVEIGNTKPTINKTIRSIVSK